MELIDIFADEGLSGMKAENRVEFQRMIVMCEHKQIDLIITKSVSRFARNVKEALEYVRKLKLLGIGIQFEKEGIFTPPWATRCLNTFTAIAQEESKSISQNQRPPSSNGWNEANMWTAMPSYGFRLHEKKLAVYDQEADIVRYVFHQYLSGWSTSEIARIRPKGHSNQTRQRAMAIQKDIFTYYPTSVTLVTAGIRRPTETPPFPFKQSKNRGQEDMFYAWTPRADHRPRGI